MAKLVDILARELKDWPVGAVFCEQDIDMEVRFSGNGRADFFAETLADEDKDFSCGDGIPWTGRVTREQWQTAVDALNAPAAWPGEGLPPVGSVCECQLPGRLSWTRIEVLFVGKKKILVRDDNGDEWSWPLPDLEFRPFRTTDQIAAEERDDAISAMMQACGELPCRQNCADLYDAGYRKQATPCGS